MKIKAIMIGLCIASFLFPTQIGKSECLRDVSNVKTVQDKVEIKNTTIYHSKIEIVSGKKLKLSQEEVDLISRVVMAEAEDEPLDGKIYVIDTILNRVDSKHFPNTVYEVIYQRGQFTSMWNGRYDRCNVNKDLDNIIKEEYKNRKNSDIVYFTADHYGENGKPVFSIGNHYFANY